MRLLTFSFLKSCKFKNIYNHLCNQPSAALTRRFCVQRKVEEDKLKGDDELVEVCPSWPVDEQPELRAAALRDMRVLPGFISPAEEAALLDELEPTLKRMRYEFDHWDNAIQGYRETERSNWRAENAAVLARVRGAAFSGGRGEGEGEEPQPQVHVLDLAPAGHIKPHVDAVRYCGAVIAGLCLSSPAVMRLVHSDHPHLSFHALLPQRALYIMKGVSRYQFTHAVLGNEDSRWRGERLVKKRRVALILRSVAPPVQPDN